MKKAILPFAAVWFATTVVVEPIPQAMFEVPAGYTKASVRH